MVGGRNGSKAETAEGTANNKPLKKEKKDDLVFYLRDLKAEMRETLEI